MLSALALSLLVATGTAPALNATQEAEARRIEAMLIAPCCWSQQVSVHQSPAADEVRRDVRVRLARGESRQQILDDYVVQFGTRILAEPPARGFNRVLYVLPPVLLVAGAGVIVVLVRRFTRRGITAAPRATQAAPAVAGNAGNYDRRLDEELEDLE